MIVARISSVCVPPSRTTEEDEERQFRSAYNHKFILFHFFVRLITLRTFPLQNGITQNIQNYFLWICWDLILCVCACVRAFSFRLYDWSISIIRWRQTNEVSKIRRTRIKCKCWHLTLNCQINYNNNFSIIHSSISYQIDLLIKIEQKDGGKKEGKETAWQCKWTQVLPNDFSI